MLFQTESLIKYRTKSSQKTLLIFFGQLTIDSKLNNYAIISVYIYIDQLETLWYNTSKEEVPYGTY